MSEEPASRLILSEVATWASGTAIVESPGDRVERVMASYWLPTQLAWINDRSRKKILEKCRRYGGSYAEAFACVEETGSEKARFDAWIGSRDKLAARLFVEDCKKWARTTGAFFHDQGEVLVSDPERNLRAYDMEFANSWKIHSLSSNPDAMAGKQGRITFDEAALHKELRQLYAIGMPAIMRKGRMSLLSTHRGSANYFNVLIDEIKHKGNPKKFSLHSINIKQGVEEGLWIKIRHDLADDDERKHWSDDEFLQSLRDECSDEEMWLQEFMCQPCDDAAALLSWEEILTCVVNDIDRVAIANIPADAPRYIGFDVARRKHLSVIWKWASVGGVLLPEDIVVMEKKKFSEQEHVLFGRGMLEDSNVKKCCIDATGLGMQLAERAVERFGDRAEGITLSAPTKLTLATRMQRRFQDRSLRIPDDAKVHYDLFSVKKQITAGDNILLRSEAGSTDGHADRFWAAALGVAAADANRSIPVTGSLC